MRKQSISIALVIIATIAALSCTQNKVSAVLDDIETYIEARPDRALATIRSISPNDIASHRLLARYSVLHAMALDKNYIDTTDLSVLTPAIDWYLNHGPKSYRFLTLYYSGVIYLNDKKPRAAMECFVEAERYAQYASIVQQCRLYVAQSKIYRDIFAKDKAITAADKAATLYLEAGDTIKYAKQLCSKALYQISADAKQDALSTLNTIKSTTSQIPIPVKANYYGAFLTYCELFAKDSIHYAIRQYLDNVPKKNINVYALAEGYRYAGFADTSLIYLNLYKKTKPNYDENAAYHITNGKTNEMAGNLEEALYSYRKYIDIIGPMNAEIVSSEIGFLQERRSNELAKIKSKYTITTLILLLIIASLAGYLILKQLKAKKVENKQLANINELLTIDRDKTQEEANYYRELYAELSKEKQALERVVTKHHAAEANKLLAERLNMLNDIAASLMSSALSKDSAIDRLQSLIDDREKFILSTVNSISISHPAFINKLKQNKLSEREIGVCCLYCIGLNGSEVGAYLDTKAIYNITSGIRKKLGISRSDTNLDLYIRKLMKN